MENKIPQNITQTHINISIFKDIAKDLYAKHILSEDSMMCIDFDLRYYETLEQ